MHVISPKIVKFFQVSHAKKSTKKRTKLFNLVKTVM